MTPVFLLVFAALTPLAVAESDRAACTPDDAFPIAGTSGYENAVVALRTNAATYGATAFAERQLFQRAGADPGLAANGHFAFQTNVTYGVTKVPVWQEDATYGECPEEYLFSMRPVDLQANNFGFSWSGPRLGLFYSASVTFGMLAESSGFVRGLLWSGAWPMYSAVPLIAAPLAGAWDTSAGASAFALDYVAGATLNLKLLDARLGYSGARGLYGGVSQPQSHLFGSVLLREKLSSLTQFKGGLDRLSLGAGPGQRGGASSVYARGLPLTEVADPSTNDGTSVLTRLLTAHVEQEDLLDVFDVSAAYAWEPSPSLHLLSVAAHTPGYSLGTPGVDGLAWRVEVGWVALPEMAWIGVEGGGHLLIRVDTLKSIDVGDDRLRAVFGVQRNDPEQLALYPFGVNAISYRLSMEGDF